ncbi:YaaA family protein [Actinomyces minihominis]|uniref:YaaA family protein n=1 Tax=Actinomyces minihominis TaxID=2002838 RepID=UPI000C0791D2|nr:peroxide stress protein YaaA [Actinomyces minihominis]
MQIWLPPSEGKTAPLSGPNLTLSELSFPGLEDARKAVIDATQSLGAGPRAAEVLKLGVKSAEEAEANLDLFHSPCAPAIDLYTGVLFDHLEASTLDEAARLRLGQRTLISSGLFGVVRPDDLIPNHRLSVAVNLPSVGPLTTWWKKRLPEQVRVEDGSTIFDCRSGSYRTPLPTPSSNIIEMSVVHPRHGVRKTITHMAKKWRGLAARHLIEDVTLNDHAGVEDVLSSLHRLAEDPGSGEITDFEVEPTMPNRSGGSTTSVTMVLSPIP